MMLEVAETAVLSESVAEAREPGVTRSRGGRAVIDDFGSAQSLAHLSGVHFDAIKLDRRFIAGDPSITRDATVAAAASIGNAAGVDASSPRASNRGAARTRRTPRLRVRPGLAVRPTRRRG